MLSNLWILILVTAFKLTIRFFDICWRITAQEFNLIHPTQVLERFFSSMWKGSAENENFSFSPHYHLSNIPLGQIVVSVSCTLDSDPSWWIQDCRDLLPQPESGDHTRLGVLDIFESHVQYPGRKIIITTCHFLQQSDWNTMTIRKKYLQNIWRFHGRKVSLKF